MTTQRTEGGDGELVNQDGEVKIFLTEPQGLLVETQKQKGRPGKCPKDTRHAEEIQLGFVEQPGKVERTRRNAARHKGGDNGNLDRSREAGVLCIIF